jgi:hypothetical protein
MYTWTYLGTLLRYTVGIDWSFSALMEYNAYINKNYTI